MRVATGIISGVMHPKKKPKVIKRALPRTSMTPADRTLGLLGDNPGQGEMVKDQDVDKVMTSSEAQARGLVPQSGDWNAPGRWVKGDPEQMAEDEGKRKQEESEALKPVSTGAQAVADKLGIHADENSTISQLGEAAEALRTSGGPEKQVKELMDRVEELADLKGVEEFTSQPEPKGPPPPGPPPFGDENMLWVPEIDRWLHTTSMAQYDTNSRAQPSVPLPKRLKTEVARLEQEQRARRVAESAKPKAPRTMEPTDIQYEEDPEVGDSHPIPPDDIDKKDWIHFAEVPVAGIEAGRPMWLTTSPEFGSQYGTTPQFQTKLAPKKPASIVDLREIVRQVRNSTGFDAFEAVFDEWGQDIVSAPADPIRFPQIVEAMEAAGYDAIYYDEPGQNEEFEALVVWNPGLAKNLVKMIRKSGPPGPPPRPGLEWKEETHRWIRPEQAGTPDDFLEDLDPDSPPEALQERLDRLDSYRDHLLDEDDAETEIEALDEARGEIQSALNAKPKPKAAAPTRGKAKDIEGIAVYNWTKVRPVDRGAVVRALKSVPEAHKQGITSLTIGRKELEAEAARHGVKVGTSHKGMFNTQTGELFITNGIKPWHLIHELGHSLQMNEHAKAVLDLFKDPAVRSSLSKYGASHEHEFFAEAYAWYLLEPDDLKEKSPKAYEAMDTFFGKTKDVVKMLFKGPPGPPPRPGLEWRERTHRWFRPHPDEEEGTESEQYSSGGILIPKTWVDVTTYEDPMSDLQVRGRLPGGPWKYQYLPEHEARKTAEKFARVKVLDKRMPRIHRAVKKVMHEDDSAAVIYVISKTGLRVGGESGETKGEQTFGTTTLQARHVQVLKQGRVKISFRAKSGVGYTTTVKDPAMARMMTQRLMDKKGTDRIFDTNERKVIRQLRGYSGFDAKVHDLRTWTGTTLAERLVNEMPAPVDKKSYEAARQAVGEAVAKHLGNTSKVALEAYIAPEVFAHWESLVMTQGHIEEKMEKEDPGTFHVFEDVEYAASIFKARVPTTHDRIAQEAYGARLVYREWGDHAVLYNLGLELKGTLLLKAEDDAEMGRMDGDPTDMTDLPSAPPQQLVEEEKANATLKQVSALLQRIVQDDKNAEHLDPMERQRIAAISEWLITQPGQQAPARPMTARERTGGFAERVKSLAKALDSSISVKAIVTGPKGTLVLKDAYSDFWDLPGGHVQDGEVLKEALIREVKEETGLNCVNVKERGVQMLQLDTLRPVVLYDVKVDGDAPILSDEHDGYCWASNDELEDLNLGVFKSFLLAKSIMQFNKYLSPSGEEVAAQRPAQEPHMPVKTETYSYGVGDDSDGTNQRYQASLDDEEGEKLSLSPVKDFQEPATSGMPAVPAQQSDDMIMSTFLDNPTPVGGEIGKEGDGGGGGTTAAQVFTPVAGPSTKRREDRMRVISRRPHTLYKAMQGKSYMLSQGDAGQELAQLRANSVHVCVTSPPYWEPDGRRGGFTRESSPTTYAINLVNMLKPLQKALTSGGSLWVIIGDGRAPREQGVPEMVLKAFKDDGWVHQETHLWGYGHTEQASDCVLHLSKQQSIYRAPMYAVPKVLTALGTGEKQEGSRFTAFPVELATTLIKATCPKGGVVVDPFVGTGSSIMAAVGNGFIGIGIDNSAAELLVAEKRLSVMEMFDSATTLMKAVDTPSKYDLKVITKDWTAKAKGGRFILAGYASPVIVDLEGHRISHEALAKDLPRFMANDGQYANVNIMHSNVTVGRILPEFTTTDGHMLRTEVNDTGLFVIAEIRTDEAAPEVCKQVIQDIIDGKLRSFSISGNASNPTFTCVEDRCFYSIDDLQFYEITICEEGVNQDAKFAVINKMSGGRQLTYMGVPLIKRAIMKGPPGPPPRPGLEWREQTHRWIRPDPGSMHGGQIHSHEGKPMSRGFHDGVLSGESELGEMEHDYMEQKRDGNNPPTLAEQIADGIENSKGFTAYLNQQDPVDRQAKNKQIGFRDALQHRLNQLTGQHPTTGRPGYKMNKFANGDDWAEGEGIETQAAGDVDGILPAEATHNGPHNLDEGVGPHNTDADLVKYLVAFKSLVRTPLGGLDIVLFDPKTGEVLLPEGD